MRQGGKSPVPQCVMRTLAEKVLWLCTGIAAHEVRGKEESTFSGLSLVFPATYPVKSLKAGGEKALLHNVFTGNSPFPREKIAGVALNERQWCAIYY